MKLLYPEDLLNMPPPEWILKEVIQKDSTILLYGPPGLGKSFMALEIAFAVAADRSDIFTVERPGSVIYVAGEGVSGIGVRLQAWQQDRKTKLDRNVAVIGQPVQLADKATRRKFIKMVIEEFGKPSLIIFDTLARCAVGMDENSAKDMGQIIDGLEEIRAAFGSTSILVHHSTKANPKTERGSGAIYGAVDTVLSLSADGKDYIKLECQKQKNGVAARVRSLELKPIGDVSCVIGSDRSKTAQDKFINVVTQGLKGGFTKKEFWEYCYPPVPWDWDGEAPVLSVTDPGGKRVMLEPTDTHDTEFKDWLEGPKTDYAFISFSLDTDWEARKQKLSDRQTGKLQHLKVEAELQYWYLALSRAGATQTKVAEWYGIPRQTFIRHYKEWQGK